MIDWFDYQHNINRLAYVSIHCFSFSFSLVCLWSRGRKILEKTKTKLEKGPQPETDYRTRSPTFYRYVYQRHIFNACLETLEEGGGGGAMNEYQSKIKAYHVLYERRE